MIYWFLASLPELHSLHYIYYMLTSWHSPIFHITAPLCGNPPVICEFPTQRASNVKFLWLLAWNSFWYEMSMKTSSNGNIFRVTGPLCGEFTGPGQFPAQRPVTRSSDVCFFIIFYLRLNKWLNKQPWGWWFETPSWSLWRHCNVSNSPLKWDALMATLLWIICYIHVLVDKLYITETTAVVITDF